MPTFGKSDYEKFWRDFFDAAARDIEPELRQSVFCISVMDERQDLWIALQVGLALVLDKPLILVVTKGTWVGPRLRQLADAIVEIEDHLDEQAREKIKAAMLKVIRRQEVEH